MKVTAAVVACAIAAASLSGCAGTRAERGAVVGGLTGAAIGGIATGNVGGAIIGGAVGAGAGYVIGKNSYACWRTNIFGQRYKGTCLR